MREMLLHNFFAGILWFFIFFFALQFHVVQMFETDTAYLRASANRECEKWWEYSEERKKRAESTIRAKHKKLFSMAFIEQIYQWENPPASVSTMQK